MREPHVLVVESGHHWDCEKDCDCCSHQYTIECPGVAAGGCETTWECLDCTDEDKERLSDRWDEPGKAHGVDHYYLPGIGWGTRKGDCYVQVCDAMADAADALEPLPLGRYLVEHECDDPGDLYLSILGLPPETYKELATNGK